MPALLLLALLASADAGVSEAAAKPPRFAIVAAGTPLQWTPGSRSSNGRDAVCCSDRARNGTPLVVQVLAERDDGLITVATLGETIDPDLHCAAESTGLPGTRNALEWYRLKLHVPRASLRTVINQEVALPGKDGTVLRLKAGLPVQSSGDGRYSGSSGGVSFEAPLPQAAVGRLYLPSRYWSAAAMNDPWKAAHEGPERSVDLREGGIAAGGRVHSEYEQLTERVEARSESALAQVTGPCLIARVSVSKSKVRELAPLAGVEGGVVGSVAGCGIMVGDPWTAAAGARIYYPDDSRAGSLLHEDLLAGPPEKSAAGHLCFDVKLDGAANGLPLCFEPGEVCRGERCDPDWLR